jgi:hypothetical protein
MSNSGRSDNYGYAANTYATNNYATPYVPVVDPWPSNSGYAVNPNALQPNYYG